MAIERLVLMRVTVFIDRVGSPPLQRSLLVVGFAFCGSINTGFAGNEQLIQQQQLQRKAQSRQFDLHTRPVDAQQALQRLYDKQRREILIKPLSPTKKQRQSRERRAQDFDLKKIP